MTLDSESILRRRANATIQRTASEALQCSGLRLMSLGDECVISAMGAGPAIVFKRIGLEGPIVKVLPANVYSLDDAAVMSVVSRLCDEARNEMAASLRAMAEGTERKSVREPRIHLWGTFDKPSEEICSLRTYEEVPNIHPSRDNRKIVDAVMSASTMAGLSYQGDTDTARGHSDPVTGNELKMLRLYALAPVGQESAAAAKMVEYIAQKHGPGRWWTELNLNLIINVDYLYTQVLDNAPHVHMRCFYFHSAVPAK